jgi:hypothetical protein
MDAAFDKFIAILNDSEDPRHDEVSRIMNTEYESGISYEAMLQSNIKRRMKEIEIHKIKQARKEFEAGWEHRFERFGKLDIDTDSDEIEREVYSISDEMLKYTYGNDFTNRSFGYDLRFRFYIQVIGWAIPSRRNIDELYQVFSEHLKVHPQAKLIDWGCGTGIWSFLLRKRGIPARNIVAIDNYDTDSYDRTFYQINATVESFSEDDVLFIAWGRTDEFIQKFIDGEGRCVIIVGETDGGCTLSSQYFEEIDGWVVEERKVDGGARKFDYMTINRKI